MFAVLCCCGSCSFSSCFSPSVVAFLLLLLLLLFLQLLLPLLLSSLMLLFVSLAFGIHWRWRQCFSISPLQRVATTTIPFPFQALLIPSLPPQQRLADGLRQRLVECHQADRPLPRRPALRYDGEEEREGGGGRGGGVAAGIGGHYGDILSHGQQAKSHTSKYFI